MHACQISKEKIFLAIWFFILLESSEIQFDLIASEILDQIFVEKSEVPETGNENFVKRKNKIKRKIDYAYVSEHCATFGTKPPFQPLLRWGGACKSLTRNNHNFPIDLVQKVKYVWLQIMWKIVQIM